MAIPKHYESRHFGCGVNKHEWPYAKLSVSNRIIVIMVCPYRANIKIPQPLTINQLRD